MREAAIPLQTPAVLGKALDDIMRALEGDIALIAKELDNPLHFDTAKVMLALGRITQLSHKFIQFLPKISAARAAFLDVHGQLSPVDAHRWGELNTRAYRTRTWVNQWPHIERLVRAQTPPKR